MEKLKITNSLINWYNQNKRDLPWRNTKDAYTIWLSEIILQQTRVSQGLPYFQKFIEEYPTVNEMARAAEEEVLNLWQGLGYYSRARNMHATSKLIVQEYDGIFPSNYQHVLALKGVGEYTAAAITSFAYDLPYPVIDGNVYRVISRLMDIELPIDKPSGQKEIKTAVYELFDTERPALWNQAIMEFGALHCTPKKPNCAECVLQHNCLAYSRGTIAARPYKQGKVKKISVNHSYMVYRYQNFTYIEKRLSGIWKNLHQFPLFESSVSTEDIDHQITEHFNQSPKYTIGPHYETVHILSHRKIFAQFHTILLNEKPIFSKSDIFEIPIEDLGLKYPTSVLMLKYLRQAK